MIQFDGTDDYINVSSSSNYAFGTGPFTIEVMIYPQIIFELYSYGCTSRPNVFLPLKQM